jgi:hypothetical protein
LLLQQLSSCFTAPSFQSLMMLVCGWIFATRRTVTGMILAAGVVGEKHHSAFHRFFASARWSLDTLGLRVFGLIEPFCGPGSILLAGDDTLARKRGLKVFGVGMHHDPLLSTRKVALTNWGHSWVVLAVIVKFPFRDNFRFALPVLFRMYRSKQTVQREGRQYFTKPQLMVQLLDLLCEHRPDRRFHLIADSAYGGQSVLCHLPGNCDLTSRLHLDARLHAPVQPSKNPKGGRPRKRGVRLPTPRRMLEERCRHIELDIYGRHDRSRIAETVAHHYHTPHRLLKIIAVEPLTGGRKVQAFYSTSHQAAAEQVLTWYAMRWSIEVMNHDAKGSLGFEQPQGWSKQAALRTAPMAMLFYSLIVLWFAKDGHRHYQPIHRPWYIGKRHASFADMLTTLKIQSVKEEVLKGATHHTLLRKPTRILLHTLKIAA